MQRFLLGVWLLIGGITQAAAQNAIEAIEFAGMPGDRVQIVMSMSQPASEPMSFTIEPGAYRL